MDVKSKFLRYIAIDTESIDRNDGQIPSTTEQWTLAGMLVKELKKLGAVDAYADDACIVYAHFPATEGYENKAAFGCIAHMDTVSNGKNIKPHIISDYDGKDIVLENGIVIETAKNPELPGLIGRQMVVTDGTTILGADDKAGIAAIMGMCELLSEKNVPHGKVCIAFTPDEEINTGGITKFSLDKFGADYAVTVDGSAENAIEYENFNAASAAIEVKGVPTHPGSARGIMINAARVLYEFHSMLPAKEAPEFTEGREGFYHLTHMEGSTAKASGKYIIREHDKDKFEQKKSFIKDIAASLNKKYGQGTVKVTVSDSYKNMAEVINQHPQIVGNIDKAIRNAGMVPECVPIRGGTDGARLTFMGLPCPNLGAGGYSAHGSQEHCTIEGMEKSAQVLLELVKIYAEVDKSLV